MQCGNGAVATALDAFFLYLPGYVGFCGHVCAYGRALPPGRMESLLCRELELNTSCETCHLTSIKSRLNLCFFVRFTAVIHHIPILRAIWLADVETRTY